LTLGHSRNTSHYTAIWNQEEIIGGIFCRTLTTQDCQTVKEKKGLDSNLSSNRGTHTHTHTFNDPLSRTTQVSRYQKVKTNLDFTEARDNEWQWHQLGHMQVCTSLQIDNHASTPPLSFYRPDALPAAQPTASEHQRQTGGHTSVNLLLVKCDEKQ